MDDIQKIARRLSDIEDMLKQVLSERQKFTMPLKLQECAKVCGVKYKWLLTRVQYKDIPAYRSGPNDPWQVFPEDVLKCVTAQCNIEPQRKLKIV